MTETTNRWNRWLAHAMSLGGTAGRANSVADLVAALDAKLTALVEAQERGRTADAELADQVAGLRAGVEASRSRLDEIVQCQEDSARATQVVGLRAIVEACRTDIAVLASQAPVTTSDDIEALRVGQERVDELIGDLSTRVADMQAATDAAHAEMGKLAERLDAGFSFDVDLGLDEDREQMIAAVTSLGQDLKVQLDVFRSDIDQLMPSDDQRPAPVTVEMLADLRDELLNELVVVRRRLKVRADEGALSDEQVDAIADAVARRLQEGEPTGRDSVRASARRAVPLSANGPVSESER